MDKIRLKQILRNFNGNENDLYEHVNVVDKEHTDFEPLYYNEIVYMSMYLFHMKYGIDKLSKNNFIPKLFDRNINYDEFKNAMKQYKYIDFHSDLLPNENNLFQEIWRLAESKLLSRDDWTKIYSSSIYGNEVSEVGKLYVSVDNKDLYQFAGLLLTKCLKNNLYDFEFKVNNNSKLNRADNLVIYFTKDNLNTYISLINQILKSHPEFQVNESHVLGYSLDDNIVLAKDYKNGGESYTAFVCKAIMKLRESGYGDEAIIEMVDSATQNHMSDVLQLVDVMPETKIRK